MIFSTIRQYAMAILGVLILSLASYGVYQHIQHLKAEARSATLKQDLDTEKSNVRTIRQALDAKTSELEALQAAISKHQQDLENLRKEQEATDAKLRQALRDSRDWADTPLPAGVRDALRKDR